MIAYLFPLIMYIDLKMFFFFFFFYNGKILFLNFFLELFLKLKYNFIVYG